MSNARSYFSPENLQVLSEVFKDARHALAQCGLDNPANRELVANRIFALARRGTKDPQEMLDSALKACHENRK